MRTLNIRFAAVLLVIAIVFGGGGYLLHGYQVERNAYVFLEQADIAETEAEKADEEGNNWLKQKMMREAVQNLSWYVRLMPDEVAVGERLGLLYADWALDKDTDDDDRGFLLGKAWGNLDRVVAMDESLEKARRKLVEIAIIYGRHQNAKEHLQMSLLQHHPDDAELWEQLGICQIRMGEAEKARDSLKKAVECGPDRVSAYMQLAILLRSKFSQPDEADQLMDKLVETNPDSAQAHYLRAQYMVKSGRLDDAMKEVSAALELDPKDVETLFLAARCNIFKRNYEEARRYALDAIVEKPNLHVLHTTLADIEQRTGNRDEALAVLERGLLKTERDIRILYAMANLLIDMNKIDRAREIITELKTTNLQRPMIVLLNARIDFVQRRWLAARKGFEKVSGSASVAGMASQIYRWTAECYGRLGNREMQEKLLDMAKNAAPADSRTSAELVDFNMERGNYDRAIEEFQALIRSGRATKQSTLAYARMLLLRNMRLPPEKRDWSTVEKALEVAEKAVPDSPMIVILRAEALMGQDRADEAETLLVESRDKNPEQVAYWRALVTMAYRKDNFDEAEKILAEIEKKFGDTPEQRIAQAQYLLRRHGREALDALRELAAKNADSFSEEQRLALWSGLLGIAARLDDDLLIKSLSGKILEKQPDNVGIHYMLFERALSGRDRPEIEKELSEIERIAGQGSYWLLGNAILLYLDALDEEDAGKKQASLAKALELLEKARESRSEWARIPVVEAGVYDALGKYDLALEKHRQAFDMGERNPNGVRRMIQLLMQSRQYTEADLLVRQLEREWGGLSVALNRMGAETALRLNEYDRALELARKGATPDSENHIDHLWLGQILGSLGARAKAADEKNAAELLADAEKAFRRAVELKPELPLTWVSLVRFLSLIGETDKADRAIEEAKLKIPEEEAPMAIAQCYVSMRKLEEAEKYYEEAVTAAPKNIAVAKTVAAFYANIGKLPQSEAQLRRIIDGKVEREPADAAWARRQLAQVFAAQRGYKNFQEARKLIEENMASPEASLLDRQFLARLNAADPRAKIRDTAVGEFADMPATSPQDQLTLAKMYESSGEWIKAGNIYRDLVTEYPQETRFLVAYIEALLRHGEISSARMYIGRLGKIAPDWFVTLALRTDLLCADKQPEKAFDLLKEFADKLDIEAKEHDARMRLAADKLNQLAQRLAGSEQEKLAEKFFKQAETYLREYVKSDPMRSLRLAVFLGERGNMDQAIDLFEKSIELNSIGDFSKASIFLSQNPMNEEQTKRLNAIVERGIEKFERHPSLLLSLAEIRTKQTRYGEAESLYREAIEKNPENAVAMNNLAVLLALQGIKLDEALDLVKKAIEIAGPLGSMLDSRASVYMARGEPEKALADIADAVADNESPVRLFHQAQAFRKAGNIKSAKDSLQKALDKKLTADQLQPLEVPAFDELRKTLQL